MLTQDSNLLNYADRNKKASQACDLRFQAFLWGHTKTTEEGRNKARVRIALEVHEDFERVYGNHC